MIHVKYVDDLTLAEAIDMDKFELREIEDRIQPDVIRFRTGHNLFNLSPEYFLKLKKAGLCNWP